jgi:CheY-like chemotaxis protein
MKQPRILVVDDNAMNLTLVSYLLVSAGCEVVSAEHGERALALLAQQREFDAILCDIQMPVMDGHEFARHVKAMPAWRHVPLVAISALAMVGDRDRICRPGGTSRWSRFRRWRWWVTATASWRRDSMATFPSRSSPPSSSPR